MDYRPEKDPPSSPVTLPQIIATLEWAAARVEGEGNRHLDPAQQRALRRHAEVLDAARKVLEVVVPHWPDVRDMLIRKRRGYGR